MNVVEIIINAVDQTTEGFTSAIDNTQSLQKAASALATVAVAEMVAGAVAIGALTDRAIENAEAMELMAQRIGAPVQEFSKLAYAEKIVTGTSDGLEGSFKKLDQAIAEASNSSESKAGKAFAAMGISLTNANGTAKNGITIYHDIAEKFSEYADGANKSALAVAIFGRAGIDMIPTLNKGRQGLEELESASSGVSSQFGSDALEYGENSRQISASIGGIGKAVARDLLPHMIEWQKSILEVNKDYGIMNALGGTASDVLKYLIGFVSLAYMEFSNLARVMAEVALIAGTLFYDILFGAGAILVELYDVIVDLGQGFLKFGEVVDGVAVSVYKFFTGDFKGAAAEADKALATLGQAFYETGEKIKNDSKQVGGEVVKQFKLDAGTIAASWKNMLSDVTKADDDWAAGVAKLFAKPISIKAEVKPEAPNPHGENTDDLKWQAEREKGLQILGRLEQEYERDTVEAAQEIELKYAQVFAARAQELNEAVSTGKITWAEYYTALGLQLVGYETKVNREHEKMLQDEKKLTDKLTQESLRGYDRQAAAAKRRYDEELIEIKKVGDADHQQKQRMALAEKVYADTVKQIQMDMISSELQGFGERLSSMGSFFKQGSDMQKSFAIASIIMNTAQAVMQDVGKYGWVGYVFAAMDIAIGAAQIAKVNSAQAHAGLDYVPREGTYLLDEGEGVLRKDENAARLQGKGFYNNGGQPATAILQIDGRELGRALFDLARDGRLQLQTR